MNEFSQKCPKKKDTIPDSDNNESDHRPKNQDTLGDVRENDKLFFGS